MTGTAGKLAGFAGVLALAFGGATVAGGAIGPDRGGETSTERDTMATHGSEKTPTDSTAEAVRGLAVSDDGLALSLEQTELERARRTQLRFSIVATDGRRVRDFEVEHEKRMHLIVVRRDGGGFQHLHPELGDDGIWRVALTLPDAGAYRVFADFKRGGQPRTLAADLTVDGAADYRPLPAPATVADTDDGYRVQLDVPSVRAGRDADLRFTVTRDGETIRTEPYLGAGGHLVALREGDLAYLHVHPGGDGDGHGAGGESEAPPEAVEFTTNFPSDGRYRLYLQFKHAGRVHTAEFTQAVVR